MMIISVSTVTGYGLGSRGSFHHVLPSLLSTRTEAYSKWKIGGTWRWLVTSI